MTFISGIGRFLKLLKVYFMIEYLKIHSFIKFLVLCFQHFVQILVNSDFFQDKSKNETSNKLVFFLFPPI